MFGLAGGVGFVVDSTVLLLCLRALELGPLHSRAISFLCAMVVTWQMNRRFTFESAEPLLGEFARFVAANSVGAAINVAVYTAVILFLGSKGAIPVIGVALGSLAGMTVNFTLSSWLVFRRNRPLAP